jgi:hypothetical protein
VPDFNGFHSLVTSRAIESWNISKVINDQKPTTCYEYKCIDWLYENTLFVAQNDFIELQFS